jgi:hypothetical protein
VGRGRRRREKLPAVAGAGALECGCFGGSETARFRPSRERARGGCGLAVSVLQPGSGVKAGTTREGDITDEGERGGRAGGRGGGLSPTSDFSYYYAHMDSSGRASPPTPPPCPRVAPPHWSRMQPGPRAAAVTLGSTRRLDLARGPLAARPPRCGRSTTARQRAVAAAGGGAALLSLAKEHSEATSDSRSGSGPRRAVRGAARARGATPCRGAVVGVGRRAALEPYPAALLHHHLL